MGNQHSGNSRKASIIQSETPPDAFEVFRKQSIRNTSIVAPNLSTKRFVERELNSLYDLDEELFQKKTSDSIKKEALKNRRQSTANETLGGGGRKRSVVNKFNNSIASSNPHALLVPTGGVCGDIQENQSLNEFGAGAASSSPTSSTNMLNNQRASSSTSTGNGISRQKSAKKSEANSHPITLNGREIIQFCWENAPLDFGTRLCTRLFEKRADFQKFSQQMGRKQWFEMTRNLRDFLYKTITKIDSLDVVEKLAKKYGEEHLALKRYGFKPDFWVTLADLLTVEGVMLDQATHTHTETVTAWSLFVSILFSSIRDGYYTAMREQRNSIRKKSLCQTTPQQLQIPNNGTSCGPTPSPTSSSTSFITDPNTPTRKESRGNNKLEVSSSRKSSVTSDNGKRQSPVNGFAAGS